jgi:hypothetical protein
MVLVCVRIIRGLEVALRQPALDLADQRLMNVPHGGLGRFEHRELVTARRAFHPIKSADA